MPVNDPAATGLRPDTQNPTERVIERAVILFAQAMIVLAAVFAGYGFLVAMFFYCCGADAVNYFHPSKSPFGPVVTLAVVWPAVGLLCLALQGGAREMLVAVANGVRRLRGGVSSDHRTE